MTVGMVVSKCFNPRSPCGERPRRARVFYDQGRFNPRSPCGERLCGRRDCPRFQSFNPRSPCGERPTLAASVGVIGDVSIHAPRAGSALYKKFSPAIPPGFQSTLPVRGATRGIGAFLGGLGKLFQSTLPVRGATCNRGANCTPSILFQSTLPVRGATSNRVLSAL